MNNVSNINEQLLGEFENGLNPAFPEKSEIAPQILGYGEISTTFAIEGIPAVALKRMPPFDDQGKIGAYKAAVDRYCHLLQDSCGISVARYSFHGFNNRWGEHILYVSQEQFPAASIGNALLKSGSAEEIKTIIRKVTDHLLDLWEINSRRGPHETIGLDGQISNWSFTLTESGSCDLRYFDITTPMLRIDGKEQLDTEIFLKSCPSFLVWLVRWQFLHEVLDRYYDMRLVMMDLVANFYKEGRKDRIDAALAVINAEIAERHLNGQIPLLTRAEVDAYYKNDAFIWRVFLALRRMDRTLKTKLLRQRYNFILPGRIRR
jgi:hypothetical protein